MCEFGDNHSGAETIIEIIGWRNIGSIVLEDDTIDKGGIAYDGETLVDFMIENNIKPTDNFYDLNEKLEECGIKKMWY